MALKPSRVYNSDVVDIELLNKLVPNAPAIETIFAPYIGKMFKKHHPIIKCKLDKFIRKFNITSDILTPMFPLWEKYNFVIAGGKMIDFFNNKNIIESNNDYDIFFTDSRGGSKAKQPENLFTRVTIEDMLISNGYSPISDVGYLREYVKDSLKLQLIETVYANSDDVIENFDIRACAICTDGKYVYWMKGCLQDNRKKLLTIVNPKSNLNAMYRISKYINKGFEIKIPDLAFVAIRFLDSIYEINESKDAVRFDRTFEFDRLAAQEEGYE